jgi:hypothetical protein
VTAKNQDKGNEGEVKRPAGTNKERREGTPVFHFFDERRACQQWAKLQKGKRTSSFNKEEVVLINQLIDELS